MENNHLKLSVRRKAALCHLTGLNFFLILIPVSIGLVQFNGGTLPIFITPTIAMMLATLLTIITWQINRKTHIFIDLSGRSAVNFMLSFSFYLLVLSTFVTIAPIGRRNRKLRAIWDSLCFSDTLPCPFLLHDRRSYSDLDR
jgi:uncharacterized Tic20 family protein